MLTKIRYKNHDGKYEHLSVFVYDAEGNDVANDPDVFQFIWGVQGIRFERGRKYLKDEELLELQFALTSLKARRPEWDIGYSNDTVYYMNFNAKPWIIEK